MRVPLRRRTGVEAGVLHLSPLKKTGTGSPLIEGQEYRFEIDSASHVASIEPAELFSLDPASSIHGVAAPRTGRLRTGNTVGSVDVRVTTEDGHLLTGYMDVHSSKLDFDAHFRWMLSGLAHEGAALLLRRFPPGTVRLHADPSRLPETRYQQLAFLGAILRRPHTVEAIERVLRQPHVAHVSAVESVPAGRGVPGSSMGARAMLRPGPRLRVRPGLTLASIPTEVPNARQEATIDNVPNRFVRFVLDHWATVLEEAGDLLTGTEAAAVRGRREVDELLALVDRWRADPKLRDVSRLRSMTSDNPVLLRRSGYREVHQAFIESEAAAMLRWEGAEAVHRAGMRDIATLYEYWCYLELRRLVVALCDHADVSSLTTLSEDGMHLDLKKGHEQVVAGFATIHGRPIDIELWFNRSFSGPSRTWTLQMRPDCSLRLRAQTKPGSYVETWVHFDAKYRVSTPQELFVDDDQTVDAKRGDLLKMHAYRDAIRRSSGAYVLYPGSEVRVMRQHQEVLPGLGAFPFVPGSDGHATSDSVGAVREFLEELLDHVATQASNRERAAYWTDVAHEGPSPQRTDFVPLDRPPADTSVLLGYCRSATHREWIQATRLYNMRFGTRRGAVRLTGAEAAAQILILHTGGDNTLVAWWLAPDLELLGESEMAELAYPSRARGRYLCRRLGTSLPLPAHWTADALPPIPPNTPLGAPRVLSWQQLADGFVSEVGP